MFESTATLVIAVDTDVAANTITAAAYGLVGNTSGEIPTLPAAGGGTGGTGGTGGVGGVGGAGGVGGVGGTCTEGELCCIELCVTNESFRAVCLNEYNGCIDLGQLTEPECRAFAQETCTI